MSRPPRSVPAARSVPAVVAVAAAAVLSSMAAPGAASADYASANTWAGGSMSPVRRDVGVTLSMVTSPGVLAGHVSLLGHTRSGKKRITCRAEQDFRVRSRATFEVPLSFSSNPALPRFGFMPAPVGVRMPGAMAVAREPDGHVHAIWDIRYVRGGVRGVSPGFYLGRWKPDADGSFDETFASHWDGGSRTRRYRASESGRLEGQLGPGGVLAGTFRGRITYKGIRGNTARYRSRSTGVVRFTTAP